MLHLPILTGIAGLNLRNDLIALEAKERAAGTTRSGMFCLLH